MSEESLSDLFEANGYLSPSQIDVIRTRMDIKTIAAEEELLELVRKFVRSNNAEDGPYLDLIAAIDQAKKMNAQRLSYPEQVQMTMPLVYGVLVYDLFVLVGVITEEDFNKVKGDLLKGKDHNNQA